MHRTFAQERSGKKQSNSSLLLQLALYRVRAGKIAEQSTIAFVSENGSPELRMAGHPALPRPSSTPLLKPVESDQIGPFHCIQPACLAHA